MNLHEIKTDTLAEDVEKGLRTIWSRAAARRTQNPLYPIEYRLSLTFEIWTPMAEYDARYWARRGQTNSR